MRRLITAVLILALLPSVVPISLAVAYAASTTSAPSASTPHLGAAAGVDGYPGTYVDDPTTNGRITRRMLNVYDQVQATFGGWPWGISCWDRHQWNPSSDHPKGRACDFTVGQIGSFPNATNRATGWRLATWARTNAAALGISYVIFDGRIWSVARNTEGWRPYDGGSVYDPGDATGGHFDHVHISIRGE